MRFILTLIAMLVAMLIVSGCDNADKPQQSAQLIRAPFVSQIDQSEREYFVYLPKGYDQQSDKSWPVMLFLHGNGERGNGKSELGFVMSHGPLYEAWIQKRDLPFIIIAPQLPMLGMDQLGISYIDDRQLKDLPKRLENGTPERSPAFSTDRPIIREASALDMSQIPPLLPRGWEVIEKDLIAILDGVEEKFKTDPNRIYLTGLSYGGFGTWYMASQHPQRFAAIVPVVGWGHPNLMAPIAKQQLPVWAFAGGRDSAVQITNFYAGLDKLEQLGHQKVRFTVHEDMEHDAWTRVYRSKDLYDWLLQQTK